MTPNFTCLYFLENEYHTLLEIKRKDLDEKAEISDVYLWLMIQKSSGDVQKLIFRSMDSSGAVQERFFEQGYLKFNDKNGTYIEKFNSAQYQLQNKSGQLLPASLIQALTAYLNR